MDQVWKLLKALVHGGSGLTEMFVKAARQSDSCPGATEAIDFTECARDSCPERTSAACRRSPSPQTTSETDALCDSPPTPHKVLLKLSHPASSNSSSDSAASNSSKHVDLSSSCETSGEPASRLLTEWARKAPLTAGDPFFSINTSLLDVSFTGLNDDCRESCHDSFVWFSDSGLGGQVKVEDNVMGVPVMLDPAIVTDLDGGPF